MDCAVRFELRNSGDEDVHIDSMTVPLGGPAARSPIRLVDVEPGDVTQGDIDAAAVVDRVLQGGTVQVFTLRFAYRADGCHGPNAAEYIIPGSPSLRLRSMGWSGDVEPAVPLYAAGTHLAGSCA